MSVRTFMRDDSPITVRSTAHAVMAANKFITAAKGAENMVARWSPTKSRLGTSSPKRQLGGIGSAAANQGGSRDASPAPGGRRRLRRDRRGLEEVRVAAQEVAAGGEHRRRRWGAAEGAAERLA